MNDPMATSQLPGSPPLGGQSGFPPAGAAATGTSTSAPGGAVEQVKEVAGQAAEKASSLVGQVKDKAVSAVEGQKAGLADQLDSLAESVHRSGEQLQGKQDWIAGAVERGAAELSTLASSLRENDVQALFSQVQSFARRQPGVFIGAMFAAGFGLARFGKILAADVSRDDLPTLPEISDERR